MRWTLSDQSEIGQIREGHLDRWNPQSILDAVEAEVRMPPYHGTASIERGIGQLYALCKCDGETIPHVFFQCGYSSWILRCVMEAAGGVIDIPADANFKKVKDLLCRLTTGMTARGLGWIVLSVAT